MLSAVSMFQFSEGGSLVPDVSTPSFLNVECARDCAARLCGPDLKRFLWYMARFRWLVMEDKHAKPIPAYLIFAWSITVGNPLMLSVSCLWSVLMGMSKVRSSSMVKELYCVLYRARGRMTVLITCSFPATDAFLDGVCYMNESVPATIVGAVSSLSCHDRR